MQIKYTKERRSVRIAEPKNTKPIGPFSSLARWLAKRPM